MRCESVINHHIINISLIFLSRALSVLQKWILLDLKYGLIKEKKNLIEI